ncbi:serine/threonine dehydratase [Jannaschia pagri]|uniref:Serine/threonine dehydratase n=1 Tax=Jannaschia pagri TaxID=2829797 RepID=A0ABQ4NK85_9RHOB|nr:MULTISPECIES: threonine/serine dehydratase [unclassified Jannaschia]GIT90925.1 serine/threonine dehydratase [Jannaschia sp. AI_61]GIT94756.1 serine/threonine dehydratase [Jannaschia sp. AI_62]
MDDADLTAPTRDDIEAAADRLRGHAVRTPLLNAPSLDAEVGRRIWVKAECLQKTGSFKFRGAYNAVSQAGSEILAYSSGNHAQGVALAARLLGRRAVIVMPSDAPSVKIQNTRSYGAEVVLYDRATEDREEIGARLLSERGGALIRPYDDARVIAGQGTCGLEIAEALPEGVTEVLVCCGGGGLSAGMALALDGHARVRTVEPSGFDDVARSLVAGHPVENAARTGSLCDAILTPMPGKLTFPILSRLAGPGMVVTDAEALRAMALAWRHLRIVLEPGGAVALAAALFHHDGDVVAVASGGNVDGDLFVQALDAAA